MKTTIIATDNIGREEKLTLNLSEKTVKRLLSADRNGDLRIELNEIMDECYYGHFVALTQYQYKRLKDFDNMIHHNFYNYSLRMETSGGKTKHGYMIDYVDGSGSGCDTIFDTREDAERHMSFWTAEERKGCEIVEVEQ